MEKMEGYGKFANRQKNTARTRGSVYESCIRLVMLYGSETMAITQKDEVIMRKCEEEC